MATSKIPNPDRIILTTDVTGNVINNRMTGMTSTGKIRYYIENGICFVNINQMEFSGDCATMNEFDGQGGYIVSGLPKMVGIFGRYYYNESSQGGTDRWHFFGVYNDSNTGKLVANKTAVGAPIKSFTFSYPCVR